MFICLISSQWQNRIDFIRNNENIFIISFFLPSILKPKIYTVCINYYISKLKIVCNKLLLCYLSRWNELNLGHHHCLYKEACISCEKVIGRYDWKTSAVFYQAVQDSIASGTFKYGYTNNIKLPNLKYLSLASRLKQVNACCLEIPKETTEISLCFYGEILMVGTADEQIRAKITLKNTIKRVKIVE